MKTFEQTYPYIASWVQHGWIELGATDYDRSVIRVLDEGGMIWSSEEAYPSLDHALAAADTAIADWTRVEMPDLTAGTHESISFTEKQGQYLAFIHQYTQIHRCPPAQADIQAYFQVTPPTVHQMILKLEELGLLSRVPGQARSIQVLVPPQLLPVLK